MSVITHTQPHVFTQGHSALRLAVIRYRDQFVAMILPRRCMLASVSMFLAGVSIPTLMILGLLPASLLLGLLGIALTALGGMTALVFCGEI